MVDFGLAKNHLDENFVPFKERANTDFRETLTYASLNAHYKKDLSRRDDLWSFFFMILDLINENLPWRNCKDDKEEIKKMKEKCLSKPQEFLFLTTSRGKTELINIFNHLMSLDYLSRPNYKFIYEQLYMLRMKEENDMKYQWIFHSLNSFIPNSIYFQRNSILNQINQNKSNYNDYLDKKIKRSNMHQQNIPIINYYIDNIQSNSNNFYSNTIQQQTNINRIITIPPNSNVIISNPTQNQIVIINQYKNEIPCCDAILNFFKLMQQQQPLMNNNYIRYINDISTKYQIQDFTEQQKQYMNNNISNINKYNDKLIIDSIVGNLHSYEIKNKQNNTKHDKRNMNQTKQAKRKKFNVEKIQKLKQEFDIKE